jgi:hypothetical protein
MTETQSDDWSDDDYDDRDPLADDHDDDDESLELVSCPECGADIYEEAEQCPVCGSYVIHQSNPWTGKPTWWVVLGFLGIVATLVALAFSTW